MKISDQERLKSQFDASRFKLSRYQSAKQILEGAVFQNCPACGTEISIAAEDSVCCLCGQQKKLSDEEETEKNKLARLDIEDRIKELNGSIVRFREAYTTQQKQLEDHKRLKQEKNHQLNEILQNYSSEFTTTSEDLIGKIASFEERINNLSRIAEMPKEATRVEKELISFKVEQENLGRQLAEEKKKKVNADHIVKEIEAAYKEALIAVSLPNFDKMDTIVLDSKSWMPAIIPSDKTRNKWDFDNIGSAGMKTLLNVCYALALHKVAAENSLPLPSLLIIDTPSKNVDKEVNREIFESLYSYIYSLAGDILSNTQLILIDNNFYKPPSNLSSIERFMTRSDKNNPPLIRNYKGST